MKTTDQKAEFVQLRAEGMSYGKIAERLHISKSTAKAWAGECEEEITTLQRERLEDLYSLYGMAKEARITRVGNILNRINEALDAKDLSELPTERLLQMKLQYERALREEYTALTPPLTVCDEADVFTATRAVFQSVQRGELTAAEAKIRLECIHSADLAKVNLDDANNPFNNYWK